MSGVRNLRAMFEQKGDAPPDRGRSPGPGGFGTPSPSASPRPLSKVRTSFVAVEKDGRIGLRREPSEDSVSVSSRRKLSNDTDATTPQFISERPDVFSDKMSTTTGSGLFKTNLSHEAIPESPSQDTPAKPSSPKPSSPKSSPPKTSPKTSPNANPDKIIDEEEPQTKMLSGDPTESSAVRLGGTVFNEGISDALNGTSTVTKAKATAPEGTKEDTEPVPKPTPKTTTTTTPAPVSTAKTTIKAAKSPLTAKPTNGKELTKAASSSANPKRAPALRTSASRAALTSQGTPNTGFVKPKPKSPTRPVKLPSSLTTHTASSAQKHGNTSTVPAPRQSLSRASGNVANSTLNTRSPSRNSVSAVSTSATRTLKHKPSSLGRSRPSLGPPPKLEAKEQHPPKRDSQVDEGFLARMMRPTQSSAKKVADKAPVSPPRRQNNPVRKPDAKDAERNSKKVTAKVQPSSTQTKTTKDGAKPVVAKEQPRAKEIAPAVAQAETAEAAVESAKLSTDTAEPSLVEDEKTETEPSAEEVADIVVQEERAEDIIETAKTSTATTDIVNVPIKDETEGSYGSRSETLVGDVSEPSTKVDEVKSAATAPNPVISEDPKRIADIEDTVQEASESKESATVPIQELGGNIQEVVDESLKPEHTLISAEEASTEAKTEGSLVLDGATDIREDPHEQAVPTTP
ncbi:hypothetical protein F4678DRAFT_128969 [Xylaria arbuscula]|nr:hypothetical protein F4678DRAFT_128969 [Xylaria arbuscula]